jgi:ADP-L-glycero-D-manno-heptose 6-epimerase
MPDAPTYIVTGGAGFVGANLVAALLARTPRPYVVVVDNFRSGSFANIVEACERAGVGPFRGEVRADSLPDVAWGWLLESFTPAAVFHLAAITDTTVADEALMIRENVHGFEELLEDAHQREIPVVYASSAATYGSPPQARERVPFPVEAAGKPNNVYGFSKWLMEEQHRRFQAAHADARVVGLRYFNVFGPGESRKGKMASMVYQLATQAIAGKRPRIFEDGSQARDQIHVDDVVSCTLAAAGIGERSDPEPGVYNLGSGRTTSYNQIVDAVREGLGVSARELPADYFPMPEAIRAFYQDYTCADMSRTVRGLGWGPSCDPHASMVQYVRHLKAAGPR